MRTDPQPSECAILQASRLCLTILGPIRAEYERRTGLRGICMKASPGTNSCAAPAFEAVWAMIAGSMLVLSGCQSSQPISSAELPGNYAMRLENSTDSLELRKNGEYHHRLWDGGNLAINESGNWSFTTKDGDPAVELSKFSSVIDLPPPHRPAPGWWIAPMGRDRTGRVFILVTRDIGLRYTHL